LRKAWVPRDKLHGWRSQRGENAGRPLPLGRPTSWFNTTGLGKSQSRLSRTSVDPAWSLQVVGGRRISEATAPVRDSSRASLIGPRVNAHDAPRSPACRYLRPIRGKSTRTRGRRVNAGRHTRNAGLSPTFSSWPRSPRPSILATSVPPTRHG